MKFKCCKCPRTAIWVYAPGSLPEEENYFCAEHVRRGCSCSTDDEGNFLIDQDDPQGRAEPCCEYDFSKDGWNQA